MSLYLTNFDFVVARKKAKLKCCRERAKEIKTKRIYRAIVSTDRKHYNYEKLEKKNIAIRA